MSAAPLAAPWPFCSTVWSTRATNSGVGEGPPPFILRDVVSLVALCFALDNVPCLDPRSPFVQTAAAAGLHRVMEGEVRPRRERTGDVPQKGKWVGSGSGPDDVSSREGHMAGAAGHGQGTCTEPQDGGENE